MRPMGNIYDRSTALHSQSARNYSDYGAQIIKYQSDLKLQLEKSMATLANHEQLIGHPEKVKSALNHWESAKVGKR